MNRRLRVSPHGRLIARWHFRAGVIPTVVALAGALAGAVEPEPPEGYSIVVAASIAALPEPLRAGFAAQRDELVRITQSHCLQSTASVDDQDRHVVLLDVAAPRGAGQADRLEAARAFPRDRDAAVRLAADRGKRRVGTLPWTLHSHFEALVAAFRSGEAARILDESGAVLHYATDAGMPLAGGSGARSTTRGRFFDRDGADPGPANDREQLLDAARLQRDRLEFEVRVSPTRFTELEQPLDAIFETLSGSFAAQTQVPPVDVRTGPDKACALVESRLEAAALLGANLIGTAWHRAGRPSPDPSSPPPATPETAGSKPPADEALAAEGAEFVGSNRSTIFHRATCPHAARIKPDNLVTFSSSGAAENAGRRPCRTCKPDE